MPNHGGQDSAGIEQELEVAGLGTSGACTKGSFMLTIVSRPCFSLPVGTVEPDGFGRTPRVHVVPQPRLAAFARRVERAG